MGDQKRQFFVPGPPKFTKSVSFPSAFRATRFRLPVSEPLNNVSIWGPRDFGSQSQRGLGLGSIRWVATLGDLVGTHRLTESRDLGERMVEYGWKPNRKGLAQPNIACASIDLHMRAEQRGTVSSNSKFLTVLFQQNSANLSLEPLISQSP